MYIAIIVGITAFIGLWVYLWRDTDSPLLGFFFGLMGGLVAMLIAGLIETIPNWDESNYEAISTKYNIVAMGDQYASEGFLTRRDEGYIGFLYESLSNEYRMAKIPQNRVTIIFEDNITPYCVYTSYTIKPESLWFISTTPSPTYRVYLPSTTLNTNYTIDFN